MTAVLALFRAMLGSLRDLLPIVAVIAFFQLAVLQEPLPHLLSILAGLVLVVLTAFAPENIIGIAYDSGGVTTSTITVPLVTALGVGLASAIKGRNPMIDGFGLIAFASLLPMMFVMVYGMVVT